MVSKNEKESKRMKRSLKMFFTVCAFAFTVLLVSGTQSKAVTNMGLKQTDAGNGSIDLEWNAQLGANHYHVQLSTDGKNWKDMGNSSSPKDYIYNLSSGTTYYARVIVMDGGHYFGSETAIDVSETAIVSTKLNEVQNLTQTGATTNSISMSWSPVAGAGSYIVYAYVNYDWQKVATTAATSVTINGLAASSRVSYCVAAVRDVTGGQIIGNESDYVYMRTVPAKVSRIAMTDYWESLRHAKYEWTTLNHVDGYQYQVQKANGKKTYFNGYTTSSFVYAQPYPRGVFVKARARAYITIGNKKLYGAWSDYTYSASNKKMTAKRIAKRKKISLKWKKISGACGYQVYISTKSNSGFKKVKTLSSKKTKYTITKCGKKKLKKNKTYYVQLKYLTKVGKKKVTSPIVGTVTVS